MYQNNVTALSETIPLLPCYLAMADPHAFSFCKTKLGELNLFSKKEKKTIHAESGAIQEAIELLKGKDLSKLEVVYIYGLGLGYCYDILKNWLAQDAKCSLHFLEEDISLFFAFLQTERAMLLMQNPQVHLHYVGEDPSSIFIPLFWKHVAQPSLSLILPYNENKQNFYDLFKDLQLGVHLAFSDVQDFGACVFKNLFHNIQRENEVTHLLSLKDMFKGMPAIVCGAGPSLDKDLKTLALLKKKAVIIAGGTAGYILSEAGIDPHFIVHVDPHSNIAPKQFHQPVIFLPRVSHAFLLQAKGEKILLPYGGGQPFERFFFQNMGELDAGWTVSNFCCSIAAFFGCSSITCLGMDFSLVKGKKYGKYAPKNASQSVQADFAMSKKWMETFCTHVPCFSTAKHEPPIKGMQYRSLNELKFPKELEIQEIFRTFPKKKFPLDGAKKHLSDFLESLNRCKVLCESYLREENKLLCEIELEEECAFTHFLKPLWDVWQWPFKREEGDLDIQKILFFDQVCKDIIQISTHILYRFQRNVSSPS